MRQWLEHPYLKIVFLVWLYISGSWKWVHLLRTALLIGVFIMIEWHRRREWVSDMQLLNQTDASQVVQNRLFRVRINENGRWITDVPDGREVGESVPFTIAPGDAGYMSELYTKAFSGEKVHYQLESDNKIWNVTLFPVMEGGRVKEVIGSAVDYAGNHDILTGLPNRKMLEKQLNRWTESSQKRTITLMFIDLDRFKTINDTAGHHVGDVLLLEVTARLKKYLGSRALISRHGGDEFSVTLPYVDRTGAVEVASELLKRLSAPYNIRGQEYTLTASIGISLYPHDAINTGQLFKNADAAMYLAKERGNSYQFYSREMNETLSQKRELETGLRKALENGEFELHYQPKVDLQTGRLIGMEALLRWRHPEKGVISPSEFIPVAEETGWIVPIGEWALRKACLQNKEWQNAGLRPVPVAVNISARQFQHPHFFESVTRILEETGLDPSYLELEMTESIFQNADTVITGMKRLKQNGVQISIDDFGTGYSSLSYLKRFPVDALKIDQSFVHDFLHNPNGAALVKAIIALAKSMNLKVIAEGIETREQKQFLQIETMPCRTGVFVRPADGCGSIFTMASRT